MAGSGSLASYQHNFVPDDEGLFCLFCGRTAGEHKAAPGTNPNDDGGLFPKSTFDDEQITGEIEEEDDWDAIQEELKRLTKRTRQEAEAREKAAVRASLAFSISAAQRSWRASVDS